MGYKYDRADLLESAVAAVLDEGLSQLTFGRLARRLDINDRSIVYYFPTKFDLITEVVVAIGARMQAVLEDAFGSEPLGRDEMVRRAWPVVASPAADPVFAVYFELVGLAAASIAPFDELAPQLVDGWIDWLGPRLHVTDDHEAGAAAASVVAVIDGLLLVRQVSGAGVADRAAAELGIV